MNGNFIDICVLEWCKLFGDLRAAHHWSKCITDKSSFECGLHKAAGIDAAAFEEFRIEMRAYRDKFIAHLDDVNRMAIPNLQPALDSVRYLYGYLLDAENDGFTFSDAPKDIFVEYQSFLEEGRAAHAAL